MAELSWIVPARRAVVAQPESGGGPSALSWSEVHAQWISELRAHRSTLLSWYAPLDSRGSGALGAAYDRVVSQIEEWRPDGPNLRPPQGGVARAPTGDAESTVVPTEIGMHVRLWKGPLRVLSELEANPAFSTRAAVERDETTQVAIGDTTLRLRLDASGEVRNEDASFVPGDVLEFPIFKLWWLCGVDRFFGASFHPGGSFLIGTAVRDGAGRLPGTPGCTLWLHDNMLAMRFQLLLNIARGGWPSLEPPFGDDYRMRHANHAQQLLGRDVYSRGMLYAGSFANPRPPAGRTPRPTRRRPDPPPPPPQDRYWFRDNNWGTGSCVPVLAAAESLRAARWNRITWGWACTPCALTLGYYMLAESGWQGGGSVNSHAREYDNTAAIVRASHVDYFHNQMFARRMSRDEVIAQLLRREGAASGGLAYLRRAAMNELFGRARTHGQSASSTAPVDDFVGLDAGHLGESDRDEILAMGVDRSATADEEVVDAESEQGAGQADAPVQASVADDLQADDQDRNLGAAHLRRYLGTAWATVGLNGHEYSLVHVEPHSNLLHLTAARSEADTGDADAVPQGPPVAGFIAAYDPLSGRGYSSDPRGDVYIYEATGQFGPSNLSAERCSIVTFTARSHRWEKVEHSYWRQSSNGTIYIGETDDGVPGTHTRRKHLVSITRFDHSRVEAIHAEPRAYFPISLHSRTQARSAHRSGRVDLDDEMLQEWYAFRAVPFPTATESEQHEIYPSVSATLENLRSRRTSGAQGRRTLRNVVEAGRGDLSAWGRDLVRGPEEAPNRTFQRQVAHASARLMGYYRDRPRQVAYEIRQLRRRVRAQRRDDSDTAVRAHAATARGQLEEIEARLRPDEQRDAALRRERQALLQRNAVLRRGDPERARNQRRLNEIAAEIFTPQRSSRSEGRRRRTERPPNLAQRLARGREERARLLRRTPELELVPLLDEQNSGRWRTPPTAAQILAQAEDEVFRTYAFRWQKILRDMGATDVRGDEAPAR